MFAYRKLQSASVHQIEERQKRVDKRRQMANEPDKENQEVHNVGEGRQPVQDGPI